MVDHQTGAVKMKASVLDFKAMWSPQATIAMMPSPIMAVQAISIFNSMSSLYGMNYTINGSYQLQIPYDAIMPESNVDIPLPPDLDGSTPAITNINYDPTSRKLTVSGVDFVPEGQAAETFKFKLFLVPFGDQLASITAKGTAPENGLIWQPFDVTPQADGSLQIILPEGVALSQHDLYIERWVDVPVSVVIT